MCKILNVKKVLIVFIILFFIFIINLTSCNKHEYNYYEKEINPINYDLLDEFYNYNILPDYSYGSLSYSFNKNLYSTYYSIELCKELKFKYQLPPISTINLNEDVKGLDDIFYILSIYDEIKNNDIFKMELLEKLNDFILNGQFFLYDDDIIYNENDIMILFSMFYGIKCIEILDVDFDYNNIIIWFDNFIKNIHAIDESLDIKQLMATYYQIIFISDIIGYNNDMVLQNINEKYDDYSKEILNSIKDVNGSVIFDIETFIELSNILGKNIVVEKNELITLFKSYYQNDGGFGFMFENSNPHIMYLVLKYVKYFNLEFNYDFNNYYNVIMRHKTHDNYFIPYVINNGENKNTYYAYTTLKLYNYENYEKKHHHLLINNNLDDDIYTMILFNNIQIDNHYEEFIETYTNEQYDISKFEIDILSIMLDNSNIKINNVLKEKMLSLIEKIYMHFDESTLNEKCNLFNMLCVYNKIDSKKVNKIIESFVDYIPSNLTELYSYIKMNYSYYNNNGDRIIANKNYKTYVQILEKHYDSEIGIFTYDIENTYTDMELIYYGIFLASILY